MENFLNEIPAAAKNFKKKPVVIQAFQLTPEFFEKLKDNMISTQICVKIGYFQIVFYPFGDTIQKEPFAMVETLEDILEKQLHKASLNDWIITGVAGEIYPCKSDIFEKTYDLAEREINVIQHAIQGFKDLNSRFRVIEDNLGNSRLLSIAKTQVELGEMCLEKLGAQPAPIGVNLTTKI